LSSEVEDTFEVNPLVSVHVGITIPGPQEYSSIRTDCEFRNINVLHDIEPQLERCLEVAKQVYVAVEKQLAEQAANASTLAVEGLGLASRFDEFERFTKTRFEQIVNEVRRQRDLVESVTPKTDANKPPKAGKKEAE